MLQNCMQLAGGGGQHFQCAAIAEPRCIWIEHGCRLSLVSILLAQAQTRDTHRPCKMPGPATWKNEFTPGSWSDNADEPAAIYPARRHPEASGSRVHERRDRPGRSAQWFQAS